MSVCIYIEREREKKSQIRNRYAPVNVCIGVAKPEEITLFSLYYYYPTYNLQV